ncbi:hypothetical protein [Porticoccus sp.]
MKTYSLLGLVATLLLACNVYAADGDSFTCTIGSIYRSGAGMSVDAKGETLDFSVNGENLAIQNTSGGKTQTYNLNVQTHNNFAVLAKNEGMIFSYRFGSGAFEWSTGIGQSGFSKDAGHTGQQMRFAGTCTAK